MGSTDDLIEKIERAFAHRGIPAEVIDMEGRVQIDSDIDDALWFQGRDWHDLTNEDWHSRHWGFGYMSPEGFSYYLQSVLTLTLRTPRQYPDLAVHSFLSELDSSPGVENLSPRAYMRYVQFTDQEFEALKGWMLWACENIAVFVGAASGGPGDGFGRVFDALLLLQSEAEKLRTMRNSSARSGT